MYNLSCCGGGLVVMTALGLVNTLRAKTRTVDPAALKDDDYGWGTYKVRRRLGLFSTQR